MQEVNHKGEAAANCEVNFEAYSGLQRAVPSGPIQEEATSSDVWRKGDRVSHDEHA